MPDLPAAPPPGAKTSTLRHRVPFFDTDGMRIVHHANYVRYLELARIVYLDEHDQPYRDWVENELHFAVTGVEVGYRRGARFDEILEITCWMERLRGASLRMAYVISCEGELVARGATDHAMVDDSGKPVRIPKERREAMKPLVAPDASG